MAGMTENVYGSRAFQSIDRVEDLPDLNYQEPLVADEEVGLMLVLVEHRLDELVGDGAGWPVAHGL